MRDEVSEEVVSFSITSPSPVKAKIPSTSDVRVPAIKAEGDVDEFGSTGGFDNDFLMEIDDLASISVHFYIPRVSQS